MKCLLIGFKPSDWNGACAGYLVENSSIGCGGFAAAIWSYQGKYSPLTTRNSEIK